MFKGDSADTCAEQFRLVLMGFLIKSLDGQKRKNIVDIVIWVRNLATAFEGLGEMFKGDSADKCARKFPLVLMGTKRRVSGS